MAAGGNWKEMFHASESGDAELVRYHLKMGVDPNYQHPEYMTGALLESVRKGNIAAAEVLLENGANPSIIRDFGTETPMSIAKENGNKTAMYLLNAYLPEESKNHDLGPQRKVLITGGNRGIGKAIAENLLLAGQKVVITSRSETEGKRIVEALKQATKNPYLSFVHGDLSDLKSCYRLIEKIKTKHPDLNTLVNNAGIWRMERKINDDGFEESFMVNYLAPYVLSKGLLPTLKENKPARIINVNSGLYAKGKLNLEKTPYGLDFGKIKTYATSKLCNVMFTIDFAKEIEGTGVTINALHPGVINTGLGDSPKFISKLVKIVKRFWKSPAQGAEAPSWLTIDEKLNGINGKYFQEKVQVEYIEEVKKVELRKQLQTKTEEIIAKSKHDV
ncbi:MAG: SDR family NAD(P)-dependent oxidoreductase [Saprospiraceae bacterium]